MSIIVIQGNASLISLADESVHCCVCSPPYWGLRSYGIGTEYGELGLEQMPDCGRPLMKLRTDLTEKQYQVVLSRLRELGLDL